MATTRQGQPSSTTRDRPRSDRLSGTALADGGGRVLWADDAFCTLAGVAHPQAVGARLGELAGPLLADFDARAAERTVVRLGTDDGRPSVRLTRLDGDEGHAGDAAGPPWAWAVELGGGGHPEAALGRPAVGYFVAGRDHRLLAVGGPDPGCLGPRAVGRPVAAALATPAVDDLVERALAGHPALGLVVQPGATLELHLFLGPRRDGAVQGVVGVAVRSPFVALAGGDSVAG